ncbi:GntR family transcriptional regulator [Streptomyces cocklensis]|uniref:GntR family transcriptional regulator n=1 Tax=Actinacidiphila cocklensis TaxID=887465 RepID=A0A9W4E997_9ACTN|nr:GntR family transcriptional regulator [Actinacidiphila cocklensis]MDD1059352.1 GntR family transcriptional regulator [Actinacidiphila cocklensis]CAG6396087.1 GntR family transcriptional regulator [Actinacidiphila cocklensis]
MVSEPSRSAVKRERVRDYLMELVESCAPGDPIPSERTLCEQLGVSRPTLRSAVDELVTTGLLVREHGRGMFVARAKITQELAPGPDAYRLPQASGSWASKVLEFTTVQAGARVGRRLHISPAAEITYIARLRLVDDEPMAIEYLHVPAALVPGLRPEDMESGDFYDFLRERHGVRVREAVQSIEPTVTNEEEARLIGVPVLSPALLFERLTKDSTGRPVEYVHSVYRGDRYRIVSRLALGDTVPATPLSAAQHHPGIPPGDLASRREVLTTGDVQPGS